MHWTWLTEYWGWLKIGHIFWFAVLGLALLRSFAQTEERRKAVQYALLVCMAYAALDELHQAFVPGRDALVQDVLLDSAAAALVLQIRVWLTQKRRPPDISEV